jgi:mono/diheme cytochrome c family protein
MWARRIAWVPMVAWLAVGAAAADKTDKKDKGRELFEDICSYCHSLHKVDGQQLSKEEWRGLIKGMISEGAPVTDEEFSMIVDYLAKHYGKRSPEEK